MAIFGFELEEIVRLIALAEAQSLDEFIYQEEDRFLRIRGPRFAKPGRLQTLPAAYAAPIAAERRALSPPRRVRPKIWRKALSRTNRLYWRRRW